MGKGCRVYAAGEWGLFQGELLCPSSRASRSSPQPEVATIPLLQVRSLQRYPGGSLRQGSLVLLSQS